MNKEIEYKIAELSEALSRYAPPTAVSFHLFVSAGEVEASFTLKSPEQLKRAGVSMRNISGNFIEPTP